VYYGKPMPNGKYISTCKIPSNFFNNGSYYITINFFGNRYTDAQTLHQILTLNINDSGTIRRDYDGNWSGVVRPDLQWKTYSA
jgi:lipopolysaccharide transport system ATP-binding protein